MYNKYRLVHFTSAFIAIHVDQLSSAERNGDHHCEEVFKHQ